MNEEEGRKVVDEKERYANVKDMIFVALLLVFHCFNLLSRRLKLLGVGDGTAHARNLRVMSSITMY